jgi:hypothetical protein
MDFDAIESEVEILTPNRILRGRRALAAAVGNRNRSLTGTALHEKFLRVSSSALGKFRCERLWAELQEIDSDVPVRLEALGASL